MPPIGSAELHALAAQAAPRFARDVSEAARTSLNEAEFRTRLHPLLEDFGRAAGVQLEFRGEYSLAGGIRADAVYNRLVIEFEAPLSLRADPNHGHTAHAIQQTVDYIRAVAHEEHHDPDRLLGIAFDGSWIIFVHVRAGNIDAEPPLSWSVQSADRFLRALVSLSSGRALIPQNLLQDFNARNPESQLVVRALYDGLADHPNDLVEALFAQWQLFFAEVTGYQQAVPRLQRKSELRSFASALGRPVQDIDVARLFFAVHTYFSLIAKIIAQLILERYAGGAFGATRLTVVATLDSESLRQHLSRLEAGGLFAALGFTNLLEGDFFSWYLHRWTDPIIVAVRGVISKLAEYDPATVELDPSAARDLLKKLYHFLLPRDLRHDLGEFYTPDWLAMHTLQLLNEPLMRPPGLNGPADLTKRFVDPACGSGTFLVLLINQIKAHARHQGLNEHDILELILTTVVGIDLNPLAVLASRVSYLLAVADLVPYRRAPLTVPVFLADSIVVPAEGETLFDVNQRYFDTVVGRFAIPVVIDSGPAISHLTNVLQEYVDSEFSVENFVHRICADLGIAEGGNDEATLRSLFTLTAQLRKGGRDGIWARILKNRFMPLFIGRFDYVVGNPPWILWDSLPDGYRKNTMPLWRHFGLFVHRGLDAILGKGKKDLSSLMTYVVMDRLLKPSGKLAFVITQSLFKGAGAAQGFRRFRLPDDTKLRVLRVDDLSALQPFEGASTRTCTVVIEKGALTEYPLPYWVWRREVGKKAIGFDLSLNDVLERVVRVEWAAEPVVVADSTSAWLTSRRAAIPGIRKIVGSSSYEAHEGVNSGGANAVYWLDVLDLRGDGLLVTRNVTEGAKRKVTTEVAALEPGLVFRLLRPGDVSRWHAESSAHILMVQDVERRRGIEEATLQERFPHTWRYLKQHEELLRNRAAFKRYYTRKVRGRVVETAPFYSMFDVGPYTLAAHKVVWSRIASDLAAAVVPQNVVPQETLTMIGLDSKEEAHYLCAVVNSVPFRVAALAYSQVGGKSFGSPHIFRTLAVPRYDEANEVHRALASISTLAHESPETAKVADAELELIAPALWKLDARELTELKTNLQDVQGLPLVMHADGVEETRPKVINRVRGSRET